MENDVKKMLAHATTNSPCSVLSSKSGKRCAVENTSTPYRSAKKRLVLECGKTPSVSPILNSTNRTLTLATPGRTASGPRTINITRGIQTITPTTTNRYCQVSVARKRKPTATVEVQTEECVFYPPQPSLPPPPPPPPVILLETGCQTDESLVQEICADTTRIDSLRDSTLSFTPIQRTVISCQADVVEELNETQNNGNGEQHQEQQERKHPEVEEPNKAQNNGHEEQHQEQQEEQDSEVEEDPSSLVESISTVLNDIAKKFGIDLQSSAEKKEKKFKSKKKEIEHLKECLAKKTYKVIASRVNANMSKIIEKHMTVYGRETVASRQRLIRWTKHFLRRQQLVREAGRPLRKIILVRKIVRAPKPPTVEEKAVQYEQVSTGITVGTQWERQKPTVPGSGVRCAKPNCPATPQNKTMGKPSKTGSSSGSNKENIPPNHQNHLPK